MSLNFREKRQLQKTVAEQQAALRGGDLSFREKRQAQKAMQEALTKLGAGGQAPAEAPAHERIRSAERIRDALASGDANGAMQIARAIKDKGELEEVLLRAGLSLARGNISKLLGDAWPQMQEIAGKKAATPSLDGTEVAPGVTYREYPDDGRAGNNTVTRTYTGELRSDAQESPDNLVLRRIQGGIRRDTGKAELRVYSEMAVLYGAKDEPRIVTADTLQEAYRQALAIIKPAGEAEAEVTPSPIDPANMSPGDPVEWRNEMGTIRGNYRGLTDDGRAMIVWDGGKSAAAPVSEVFPAAPEESASGGDGGEEEPDDQPTPDQPATLTAQAVRGDFHGLGLPEFIARLKEAYSADEDLEGAKEAAVGYLTANRTDLEEAA